MELASSHLPWIWFIESLAANKQVDYLSLRDVSRKVPGLSGSAVMHARERLALRCLEGLAEIGSKASGAAGCGSKIGLDLSRRCSVVLFHLTSEHLKSDSGLDGLDVSKWDMKSFVEHKREQLPKCTLEWLEEMIVDGKDPAAVSLREISGFITNDRSENMDIDEGAAKFVSLSCDETSHHRVAASVAMDLIPENEEGSCKDRSKDVLIQKALVGEGNFMERDGDVLSNPEKSIKDMQVGDKRKHTAADTGDRVTDQGRVTSPLKEDESDTVKEPQDNDIGIERFPEKCSCDDQHVHTLRDTQKQSSGASLAFTAQTVLGEDFREETKLLTELEAPVNSNCNQQQAAMVDQTNNTTSDSNQNCDDGLVSESVVETSTDNLENKGEPSNVKDNPLDNEGYDNEDVDDVTLKNNFLSSHCTAFDWSEPVLCMKCNKSGTLLCCDVSVCSVAVHRECLGVEPCFADSGSFRCPFCASSLASVAYLEAKGRARIRKRELDVYLSSSLSNKLPQHILNKKKRRNSKQDDMSYTVKGLDDEDGAETDRNQPNHSGEHGDHIIPEINGDADINPTPESPGAGMGTDLPDREINNKATGNSYHGVIVEPSVLQVKDTLPPRGKGKTTDRTACQMQDDFTQPPLTSEEFEHENNHAIILYEGDKGCDKTDTISQNPPESKIKHVRASRNIPNIMISKPTSNVEVLTQFGLILSLPYQSYPAYRRRKVPWCDDEENKLREGVKIFHNPEAGTVIPWSQILEFGALVFKPCRTAENLKDKWRNICKKDKI